MKTYIKTITVDRKTNKTIKEEIKAIELDYDPWEEMCKVLAEKFLESREGQAK